MAEAICGIVESKAWQLRHPVGPGAEASINLWKNMMDAEWVERGALDDDAWYERIQKEFGLDARLME